MTQTDYSPLAQNNPDSPRLQAYSTLDMWRGFACLAIVLHHEAFILTGRSPQLASFPLYRASAFGYLGVQMFFVISGYCIAGAAGSARRRLRGVYARPRPPGLPAAVVLAGAGGAAGAGGTSADGIRPAA